MGTGKADDDHCVDYQMFARLTSAHDLSSDDKMSATEIERLIPHRPPMLLIDEILTRTESTIVCRKTFDADEHFVQGHFPDSPIVPGVIQCECCLQAGAILLAGHSPTSEGVVPVVTRMDAVKFKRIVRPGDTVELHVTLNERVSSAFYLTGKVMLNGKVASRLDFAVSVTNPRGAVDGQESGEKS
jgi:3-hydroxyacyl-[acyl-carrier-protein] dehydratase